MSGISQKSEPVTISDLLSRALTTTVNSSSDANAIAEQFAKRHGINREELEALGSVIALALGLLSTGEYADPGSMMESEALNKIHQGLEVHMGDKYCKESAHAMAQMLVASWITQLTATAKAKVPVLKESLKRRERKGFERH